MWLSARTVVEDSNPKRPFCLFRSSNGRGLSRATKLEMDGCRPDVQAVRRASPGRDFLPLGYSASWIPRGSLLETSLDGNCLRKAEERQKGRLHDTLLLFLQRR